MRKISSHTLSLVIFIILFFITTAAQGQTPAESDLKKKIDALQSQLDALRKELEIHETEIETLKKQEESNVTEPQEQSPSPKEREVSNTARRDTFNRNQESVARINNQPLDPSLQGFFNIPNTRARMKIDGYVKFDTIIDPRPAGDPNQFTSTTIPVTPPGGAEPANVNVIARQTRFITDFRSPTRIGDLRVYLEGDFYGPDGTNDPRLRLYYGQLDRILIGQYWTLFTDPDTNPDTIDYQGPAGVVVTRRAQFRWTQPINKAHSIAFSAERPLLETRQFTKDGSIITPAPDGVISWRYEKTPGHIQVGSIFRALGYDFGDHDETVFGWGLSGSIGLNMFENDHLQLFGTYGAGIASLIENLEGLPYGGYDLEYNNEGTKLKALPAIGAYAAYQHYWSPKVRSTFTFGYDRVQNTVPQPNNAVSKSYYASGNLIWNPVGNLNVGAEFLHGWQDLKDNSKANANRIQLSIKYDLYRKKEMYK